MFKPMLYSSLLSATFVACAGEVSHWSYEGQDGPTHWAELAPDFSACSSGKNQSPVNITGAIEGNLPELGITYQPGGYEVINNGHTIQVNYQSGSFITVDGTDFELRQFHFHSPSENLIESRQYPMEVHFVHTDDNGNLAVLAVMFTRGEENRALKTIWQAMPEEVNNKATLMHQVSAGELIPEDRSYFRFNGSLTTPPCSEGVTWIVLQHTDDASDTQLNAFLQTLHHTNNRPVQPLNARVVIR